MTSPCAAHDEYLFRRQFLLSPEYRRGGYHQFKICLSGGYLVASPKGLEALKEAKKMVERIKRSGSYFFWPQYGEIFSAQMQEWWVPVPEITFLQHERAMIFWDNSLVDAREKLKQVANVLSLQGS